MAQTARHEPVQRSRTPSPPDHAVQAWTRVRNLKIDQPGASIGAHEDILTLLEIDVGHATLVQAVEYAGELREEIVAHLLIALQRMALNESMGKSCPPEPAKALGHAGDTLGQPVHVRLVFRRPLPQPSHGQAQQRLNPTQFKHHATARAIVQPGGCKEVVLESAHVRVSTIDQSDFGRHLCRAERPQPGVFLFAAHRPPEYPAYPAI